MANHKHPFTDPMSREEIRAKLADLLAQSSALAEKARRGLPVIPDAEDAPSA
jgi:hypothetical protein